MQPRRNPGGGGVLNIGRMGPGSQRYYLESVARTPADYYLGHGESPGQWIGWGSHALGLDGVVTAERLEAILDGLDPNTGEHLGTRRGRTVPGFDLAFRAPKSVSLLWGLSDEPTSRTVQDAHDRAVAAAFSYIEREVARSRRGKGGAEQVHVQGLVAATFRHRTSREDDPLLHTHVLVANVARCVDDGQWRTLDSRRLYKHCKTAGTVYQSVLRHELTQTLGVEWQPVVNGCADLAGVDRDFIEAFSTRRHQILEALAERGETSAKAAQVATLATRKAKHVQVDEGSLRDWWRRRAETLRIPPDWWRQLLHRTGHVRPDAGQLIEDLLGPDGLTQNASAFTRRDVVREVAARLPHGATLDDIQWIATATVKHGDATDRIVRLAMDHDTEPRATTRELLEVESNALIRSLMRADDGAAALNPRRVEDDLVLWPGLSLEQKRMVEQLVSSGVGVEVIVGKAGTGKTYALDAARHLWNQRGVRVTGTALAARAALELEDSAGIPSTTVARLLGQLDRLDQHGSVLRNGDVLVVDEAGMVGTRQLARLLDHTERLGVKTVLVGDPHQLPAIEAGGLFSALYERLPAIELADNHRQRELWEQMALEQMRAGDVASALGRYDEQGRIVEADTVDEIRSRLVDDWWEASRERPGDPNVVMIALRRADVDDLNHRARVRLGMEGQLGPYGLATAHGLEFLEGERIVCLRNDRLREVTNGTRGTVTGVDGEHGLVVHTDQGATVFLDRGYLDAGHVAHGYAITGHKAQGLTVDHALVLGSEALYREWGYVAMSRGRHTNRLYIHRRSERIDGGPHTLDSPLRRAQFAEQASRSRAEQALTKQTQQLPDWAEPHRGRVRQRARGITRR